MARQANTFFLEEWLKSNSGSSGSTTSTQSSSSSSARGIIQAWAELRDSLQHRTFQPHHLQSLKTLLDSQISLHVADPQARLLISILSSQDLNIPLEAYPLLLRLLYIWVRKSFRPTSVVVDSAVIAVSNFLATELGAEEIPELFSEGVILLGALSFVPSASENSKIVCLDLLSRLLEERSTVLRSFQGLVPDVLAGIGYALCSSLNVHYVRILRPLLGMWGKEEGPQCNVSHGLMILHLVEWVISGLIKSNSSEKLQTFSEETLEISKGKYVPFALVMAAAGVLRTLSKYIPSGQSLEIISRLRISSEKLIESVAQDLVSTAGGLPNMDNDCTTGLLLQCISLALARAGSMSSRAPVLICLASALSTEIFPLRRLYTRILVSTKSTSAHLGLGEVQEHLNSVPFKEAGIISGVFCNHYVSIDEETKATVENMIWNFCQELYMGHREVSLLLRGREDGFLGDIEKISESAFLMVVVFALAVTKHKLNSKISKETQMETSVSILISFSCVEYFRRIRLPEYMDTIRGVVMSIQENEAACVSFVESMPPYVDLTSPEFRKKLEYMWFKDEMQTARILFYLRVIPTFIERVPNPVFTRVVAPTMFLYIGHPNGKVARASHSMFAALASSGKDSSNNERASLKEQLAFYYINRSLEGYPDITPFEGMASGVAALARNLPAGSPATFYCVHGLVEKTSKLCGDISIQNADMWENWEGESDPCKKILELLLRLISLVDIQVLPYLMKLLAQLVVQLPKDGQNVILNELYSQVAESEDVTRKPTLVLWLQSLSYLCSQATSSRTTSIGNERDESSTSSLKNSSNWDRINARL